MQKRRWDRTVRNGVGRLKYSPREIARSGVEAIVVRVVPELTSPLEVQGLK